MFKHWAMRLSIALSGFVAPAAQAFVDPPWITPAEPRAGEVVSVNTRMGICDVVIFSPSYPQVTQEGNAIRIVEYGNHYLEGDERCVYPIGTGAEPIGTFPPGDYTVTVDFLYEDYPFGYAITTLGVIPFTVTRAVTAAPVPAFGPSGLFVLLLLVSGLAVWKVRTHHAGYLLILLLTFVAQSAQAFIDPPWITPTAPRANETVSVNIRGGLCDGTVFLPGYPQITQEGNAIRIIEYGVHEDFEDFCFYPIGTLTEPIGAFPPGDYMLTVDFLYEDFVSGYTIITLGVVPFTVTGAALTAQVPTSNKFSLFALLLLISGLAIWTLRMRRRCS